MDLGGGIVEKYLDIRLEHCSSMDLSLQCLFPISHPSHQLFFGQKIVQKKHIVQFN